MVKRILFQFLIISILFSNILSAMKAEDDEEKRASLHLYSSGKLLETDPELALPVSAQEAIIPLESDARLIKPQKKERKKEKKKELPATERKWVESHPLLLGSDEEEIVPDYSPKKKSSDLKHEPYEKPVVAPIHVSPEDFKKAWNGNHRLQALIRGWVNNFENADPQIAGEVICTLRTYARNHAPHSNTSLKDMGKWAIISGLEDEEENIDTRRLLDFSINEDQIERGMGRGKDLPPVNLPEGWDLDSMHSKKIIKFLRHLEHYTFQNETTWKQWAGMTLFAMLGGLAAWPDVPVFTVGVGEIVADRFGDQKLAYNNNFSNFLISYVLTTALLDNVPRMAWCARRFLAPSTQEFSVTFNKVKKYGLLALVAGGAIVPTVVQLFYLISAEKEFAENAKEHGYPTAPFKQYVYIWGPFYAIEAGVWSLDQLNNFKNWVHRRFFRDKIPDMFPSEISHFRKGLLDSLDGLEKAFYWMPDQQIRQIYDQVFDPNLLSDMKAQAPEGDKDQWDCMMGFCRLRYLVNMANHLQEDIIHVKSVYKGLTEWLSMGSAFVASAGRLLGLQIVFQLLFQELSGGYISPASAEIIGWVCSAAFGLLAQGGAEVIGNVDFFHYFLWNTEPQGETALRGLRYLAKGYTAIESAWNLVPLGALCLDGADKFFGGNYYWMFLFSPYILNEFFGGAVTLTESYVKNIPTTINRGYNRARRLCGFQNTTGYMRDELVLMVGRMKDLLTEADLDVLMFIQNNVVNQRELEHHSSSSEELTRSNPLAFPLSPEGSPKGNGKLNDLSEDEKKF